MKRNKPQGGDRVPKRVKLPVRRTRLNGAKVAHVTVREVAEIDPELGLVPDELIDAIRRETGLHFKEWRHPQYAGVLRQPPIHTFRVERKGMTLRMFPSPGIVRRVWNKPIPSYVQLPSTRGTIRVGLIADLIVE